MMQEHNVIYHTLQRETSHSRYIDARVKNPGMEESETFRANLLAAIAETGTNAAELSKKAGLNARAVKDIEERRTRSPKLSTVFALASALGRDPAEMMGLGPRVQLHPRLAALLSQYDESEQELLVEALSVLGMKA